MRRALLTALGALLALAAPAVAEAGPGLTVGAVEDDVRLSSPVEAEARMALFRVAGFRAVRVTSLWQPGQTRPTEAELDVLENVADAASRNGVRVYVTVMHPGSRTTPLTDEARGEFAANAAALVRAVPGIRHVIVGNEPNLNRFWLPQFELDGTSAAPAGIPRAARPDLRRAEGGLAGDAASTEARVSPRGSDRAGGTRPTHSPTKFIQELGVAYRASGRDRPVMDALSIHPYGGQLEPTADDRASQHDLDRRSRTTTSSSRSSAQAFDGTAQLGSKLPILYAEFGVESQIPTAKSALYTGDEPAVTRPVDEPTQAAYYEQALALSFCQPTVEGMLIFLVSRRTGARRLAVGRPLRRRHGEDQPSARDGGARPLDGRLDRPLPRRRAHRPAESAPLRDSSGRQARDLPRQPHLRSRLRLRAAGRAGVHALDEDGEAGPPRGRASRRRSTSARAGSARAGTATRYASCTR